MAASVVLRAKRRNKPMNTWWWGAGGGGSTNVSKPTGRSCAADDKNPTVAIQ